MLCLCRLIGFRFRTSPPPARSSVILRGSRARLRRFEAAREHGIPTVLDIDLGSGQLLSKVIGLTDYAIFSAPAFRLFVEGADDQERLTRLINSGVLHAGVTLGAKGYTWMNRRGEKGDQAAFPVETVDSTGAGDAFHGAFTWALAAGLPDSRMRRIASAAAALSCRRLGARAGLPTKRELEDFCEVACYRAIVTAIATWFRRFSSIQ